MSNCAIFKKSLFKDISDLSTFTVNTAWLKGLVPEYNESTSGIWLPIVIDKSNSNIQYVDILTRATKESESFNPCSCIGTSGVIQTLPDDEDSQLDCSYCSPGDYGFSWTITDQKTGNTSPSVYSSCCNGACDVRLTKDDYLAKLPVLNNSYLTQFYDWKYKQEFPACSNYGLGYENFASCSSLDSFSSPNFKLVIDWKIKERISEIPPNDIDSYHKDIDSHQKSYERSLINSKTCGNFILTKLNASYTNNPTYSIFDNLIGNISSTGDYSSILPNPSGFTKPYGFKNQDHYNIFVKTEKLGSYWKWNYSSGILCWYRYYDINKDKDDRLIKGVDLFISEGDVFFATNDGPEGFPSSQGSQQIKNCPSGLKLIKNDTVTGIIPAESEFLYISENIYNKTYSIINRLTQLEKDLSVAPEKKISPLNKLKLSALLATGPNYYEVTVDLLKTMVNIEDPSKDYDRDIYKQIILFNKAMLSKPQNKDNRLNIVKTNEDLLNTLANKYGCYIWCPPDSSIDIKLKKEYDPHCYIDLDFEPTAKLTDTKFSRKCSAPTDCLETTTERDFSYSQKFNIGNFSFKTTSDKRFKNMSCTSGDFSIERSANIISAYFNDKLVRQEAYGSGCSVFYQKYLRAPSYDLALKAIGESLCSNYKLCNKTLAFKYNNDKNLWNTPNQLQEGVYQDSSLILDRRYPANITNPNIDRIGFNTNGGVYYDSNTLGSGNVIFIKGSTGSRGSYSINFSTKNLGLKIYNISIYKLRDKKNTQCRTFPLDQACKCFPLISVTGYRYNCDGSLLFSNSDAVLYTPNISTQSSPEIKSYGGYTDNELNNLVGSKRIINHPSPGTIIPAVNKIIDPLNPYECSKEITVSLPNYIYNKWKIILSDYSTIHSDIWIKLQENTDLFNPTIPKYYNDGETDYFEVINNPSYRRYTTKATVGNVVIYNKQQKILFNSEQQNGSISQRSVNIEFKNPFLIALLKEAGYSLEKIPYTPLSCSMDTTNFDGNLVNIAILFKQVPRKQVLNFAMQPITPLGELSSAFFHPNQGLISSPNNRTSLSYYKDTCYIDFDYERNRFNNNDSDKSNYSVDGFMLSGNISDKMMKVLDWNNSLLSHKKLRLYLKYNNIWYEYLNPHVFGFFNKFNDEKYPGYPLYFEYSKNDLCKSLSNTTQKASIFEANLKKHSDTSPINVTTPSQLIPISAKNNTEFLYFKNIMPTGNFDQLPRQVYPLLLGEFNRDPATNNRIIFQGSRPYFLLKEKDLAVQLSSSIENMTETQGTLVSKRRFVVQSDGTRWKYSGSGSLYSRNSYKQIAPRNYRDHNFSDLWIDETNTDSDGYIIDSERDIDGEKFIKLSYFDSKEEKRKEVSYKITKKFLSAKKIDMFGNLFGETPNSTKKPYSTNICTYLELQLTENDKIPVDGLAQINTESYVILQNFRNSVKSERDELLVNRLHEYDTKWGDLINFDKRILNDINNPLYCQRLLDTNYPKSIYDNLLYKITVNNLDTGNFRYVIKESGTGDSITNNYKDIVYYNIHQRYNIGLGEVCSENNADYRNYLPIIDVDLLNNTNSDDVLDESKPINSGLIYISGIRSFAPITGLVNNPDSGSIFFVSLNNNTLLRPILFNREFYYDTLRVDDVYFRLLGLSKQSAQSSSGCATIFEPNIRFTNQTFSDYFDTKGFDLTADKVSTIFNTFPIYCDTDAPGELCGNKSCSISTIGYTKLQADYKSYKYSYIKAENLKNSSPVQFALSVDEGLYNAISNDSLPYIQRFEIPPNSNLFNNTLDGTDNCILEVDNRPSRKQTYIDIEYQTKLKQYILSEDSKGDLVKNTDILANEMLFRLMYDSKQKISTETINKKTITDLIKDSNKNSISHLVQYSDPRTTPEYIYELIPYDYAIDSDSTKRKINGSINIDGVLTVGSTVSVSIGGYDINITITNINNKICAVASCNNKTYTSQIFDTKPTTNIMTAVVAGTKLSNPSENTKVTKLTTCKGGVTPKYWSKGKYFTSMTIHGKDGNDLDVVQKYKECVNNMNQLGCSWGAHDSVMVMNPALPGNLCPGLCPSCSPRGWAAGPDVPSNCTVITTTNKTVKMGSVSRGLFRFGSCSVANGGVSISPALRNGDFDAYMGGLVIRQHAAQTNCNYNSTCRGNCMSLDSEDRFGKIFDPLRYIVPSSSYEACECQNYNTGYCSITENSCQCKEYAKSYPKIFQYEFQNCNYTFNNMKGHIYKFKDGDPIESNKANDQFGCSRMDMIAVGEQSGEASEECYWLECNGPKPSDWDIYNVETVSPAEYNPKCPVWLCTITYDNNKATISMIGGKSGCFDIKLRKDCPVISIRLPNNTFSFSDSINSECTMCDVEKNVTLMDPPIQYPDWDIITETRTAILGYLPIEGDKNINLMGGGGVSWTEAALCGDGGGAGCCFDNCYVDIGASLQCGKSAPESWPWEYALECHLNGSAQPSFTPCITMSPWNNGTHGTVIGNVSSGPGFAIGSDNTTVKKNHIEYWKETMRAAYYDISACHNNYGTFNVNDLVEGIIPGSCTNIKFELLNYPMVAFRQTLDGGDLQSGYLGVHVAYFQYEYKRPRTINDIFLKDNDIKCSTRLSHPATSSYNITEKYTVKDCDSVPSCFDTSISPCTSGNICCEQHQVNGAITARP